MSKGARLFELALENIKGEFRSKGAAASWLLKLTEYEPELYWSRLEKYAKPHGRLVFKVESLRRAKTEACKSQKSGA